MKNVYDVRVSLVLFLRVPGTTDSTASEEDMIPPPLPQKARDADYCNLPDEVDSIVSESVQLPTTPRVRNKVCFISFV
jgi:hypothetical protein